MYRWIVSIDTQVARFSFRVTGITYAVYTLLPRRHQTSRYHRRTNDEGWLLACEHHGSAYTVSSRQETCGEDDGKCDSKFFFCCWKKCYVTGLFRVVQYCTCLLELHSLVTNTLTMMTWNTISVKPVGYLQTWSKIKLATTDCEFANSLITAPPRPIPLFLE